MAKLFVGSLPPSIDEITFAELFSPYGTIVSSVCNADKRYGFVTYSSAEEAQSAIASVNGYALGESTLVVKLADNQGTATGGYGRASVSPQVVPPPSWANPAQAALQQTDRIYVKGLPAGMTEEQLRKTFNNYGTVLDSKVLVADGKSNDGTGQSVAILRMETAEEASWIVDNLDGNIPQGLVRAVEVSFAGQQRPAGSAPPTNRYSPYGAGAQQQPGYAVPNGGYGSGGHLGGNGPGSDSLIPGMQEMLAQCGPQSALYVKGLPLSADDLYLYKAFAPFGCVLSAKAISKDSYAIGFVHYASDAEAAGAIAGLNGQKLTDGTVLTVSVKTPRA